MLGRTISRYQVEERLGAGGMGVAFKARDTLLERTVVLKALPAESTADEKVRRIALGDGFTVDEGASFTAVLDPTADCVP